MIRTFADTRTREIYVIGRSGTLPPDITRQARRKLEYVDAAMRLEDLNTPPGNKLHQPGQGRQGQYAIRINEQWRVCFRSEDGDAFDVGITDYHQEDVNKEYA